MEHIGRTWYIRLEQTQDGLLADFGTWSLGTGTITWDRGLMGHSPSNYTPREILSELYTASTVFMERWV